MTDDDKTVGEISQLTKELTTTLRRIDENKLNAILDVIPDAKLSRITRQPLPQLSKVRRSVKRNVDKRAKSLVQESGLLDESDYTERLKLFIGHCRFKGYTYNTTVKYINMLKALDVFGEEPLTIKPSKLAFVGRPHERMITVENFAKLAKLLHERPTRYTAPILTAVYTGLRTFELLQMSTQTLYQLISRQEYVSIVRKQTVVISTEPTYWKPVYTAHFTKFIDLLVSLYREEYEVYKERGINDKLFHVTPRTLVNRIRQLYFAATGSAAPHGFGIHSCRNLIATIMSNETDNISSIQSFLQHRDIGTTKKYINVDLNFIRKEFDRLTKVELTNVNRELEAKK